MSLVRWFSHRTTSQLRCLCTSSLLNNKLFVGGLSSGADEKSLKEAFSSFGDVTEVWASGWKATPHHSFGFSRFEVLGALLSVQLIWLMAVILIYEAVDRMLNGGALVNGKLMFLTAAFGVFINSMMFTLLGHDHHSHNGHCSHESEEVEEAEEISLVTSHAHEHHQLRIVYDKLTGRSRGFGFVHFAKDDEARSAKDAMDGKAMLGRPLRISFALEKVRGGPVVVPRLSNEGNTDNTDNGTF